MTRLGASVSGIAVALSAGLGCLSLRDLSSYSEGEPPGVVEPPAMGDGEAPSENENSGDATVPLSRVDAGVGEPASVEARDPGSIPVDTPSEPPPSDPAPTVPETMGAVADTCMAAGEFINAATSSCYLLSERIGSWQSAREFCQAWGGDLVEIESADENALLRERADEDAWIGANDLDVEGLFRWADGGAVQFTAWAFTQPDNNQGNEDCAELRGADNAWNDVPCEGDKRAWCERPLE